MGMSGPGEIAQLAAAVRPTAGIITMIGVSHMERLGSREGILKAKLELADALPGGAPLVLNADDGLLFSAAGRYAHLNVLFFGVENPAAHVRAKDVRAQGARTDFTIVSPWGEFAAAVPALGEHNVKNALAAFCAGCALGVAPKDAAAALENYQTTGMRQRVTPFAGATVVEDCYNCSPDSLAAAAKTLAGWPGAKRRILVLSDMLELGGREKDMHRECGHYIAQTGVDTLFLCGELSRETAAGACEGGLDSCAWFASMDEMAMALKQLLAPGDVVWLKASRGMRLERVLERLYERKEDV
jgi:UDP-N-acetylmuramoyl-tripeptide--D-alanyl-D-alanine ligase